MDKLLTILKTVTPNVDYENCETLVDDGLLDSIDIVSIISEIEKEYSVEIDPADIDPFNFQSLAAIREMVEKLI